MILKKLTPLFLLLWGHWLVAQSSFPLFLQGTWQVDGKNNFEGWEMVTATHLRGSSYSINGEQKRSLETLDIYEQNGRIFYAATVPNQNDGKTIPFVLEYADGTTFSFENEEHDFPKKIVYTFRSDHKLSVRVSGSDGQGFTLEMTKIKTDVPTWYLQDIANQVGTWVTDNARYQSDHEPFDRYVMDWNWNTDHSSIRGSLYGMVREEKSSPFWNYLQYWDASSNEAILLQTGPKGISGSGTVIPTAPGETNVIQTFAGPDFPPYQEKHVTVRSGNHKITTSFHQDSAGQWQPGRSYTWYKDTFEYLPSSRIDTLPSGELMLVQTITLPATVTQVWNAYTTESGWKGWVTPVVEMDFRINGTIKSHYDSTAHIGDKGTIVTHILNYVPHRQITMQAELTENFPEFMQSDAANLYSIVTFESLDNNRSKLTNYGIGYKNEKKWLDLLQFFIRGNEQSLLQLKKYLSSDN
ncbi:MAG: SRPBCC domain-containing protein [Saprospiraceae bacterium]|nr:SRPBCC domain-containing protein [Saprospiraceae bacterium]